MKLLFVIDNLGSGGAQRQMVNLAIGLANRGHCVEFFTYYPADHYQHLLDAAGIAVSQHHKRSRFSLTPLLALRRLVRSGGYQAVLSFLDTPNFYAELATLGSVDTRLVVSERCMYTSNKLPLVTWLLQNAHRLADVITVNSHHQRLRMERIFPWMRPSLLTIYNGYDLDAFSPGPVTDEHASRADNRLNLIAISSVARKKNPLNVVRALALCRDRYGFLPVVNWVGTPYISGAGTMTRDETDQLLAELDLQGCWHWLGEQKDIAGLIRNSDALLHASFFEGLPNVVCEALACGRPVLISDVCDHARLVENGVSGFLFDPHSPDSIAAAMSSLQGTSKGRRREMGAAGRRFAEANLSLGRYVDEYERVFEALAGTPPGGRHVGREV